MKRRLHSVRLVGSYLEVYPARPSFCADWITNHRITTRLDMPAKVPGVFLPEIEHRQAEIEARTTQVQKVGGWPVHVAAERAKERARFIFADNAKENVPVSSLVENQGKDILPY